MTTSTATRSSSEPRAKRIANVGFNPERCETELVRTCNLCSGATFCAMAWTDRYGYPVQSNLCLGCGLVFLSPRLTAGEYGRFYDGIYRPLVSAYHGRLIDAITVEDEQKTYTRNLLRFLLPQIAGHAVRSLLDVGGSTGVIAEGLRDAIECEGIVLDPSPDELKRAEQRGLRTVCALVEEYDPAAGGRFDLVLLCQTVDHLLDVHGALSSIRQMMTDDGFFYVDFVDFETIVTREGGIEGAIKIDHPYYFTRETMEAYLRRVGFAIQAMMIMPDGHHVGYLCRRAKPVEDLGDLRRIAEAKLQRVRDIQARVGKSG